MPSITEGNQKWAGAAPIFSSRAEQIIVLGVTSKVREQGALAKMMEDPSA